MNHERPFPQIVALTLIVLLLVACGTPRPMPTPAGMVPTSTRSPTSAPAVAPADQGRVNGPSGESLLSEAEREAATLGSLEQVDDYPLYTMRYYADYAWRAAVTDRTYAVEVPGTYEPSSEKLRLVSSTSIGALTHLLVSAGHLSISNCVTPVIDRADGGWASLVMPRSETFGESLPAWACSLFAALGDADNMLYGRNFDWEYSPALLLFADPPDGYASVSMVDIAYLGFEGARAGTLTDLTLAQRLLLLEAPFWPFDGMNERGLVVGMAAVPESKVPYDRDKEAIDSLVVIREILDHAGNVDQAVAILQSYNVQWDGGPALHYLIADSLGSSVLVEFYEGELVLIPGEVPWHLATNHLRAAADESGSLGCQRYDKLRHRLTETQGRLATREAIDLLKEVAQGSTQWSIVYGMSTGQVDVIMGRKYDEVHVFHLDAVGS